MARSIASINSLLVNVKTLNATLLVKLKQLGFNPDLTLGAEKEYTVKTLIQSIDTLAIQFLTATANSRQFVQRTCYAERQTIISCLGNLHTCLLQTQQDLQRIQPTMFQCHAVHALVYTDERAEQHSLKLLQAAQYLDAIKPCYRLLEMISAHERIHAISAVLENIISQDNEISDDEIDLTEEQSNALELSQYLIHQAL
ncbi:hypothetical protein MNBD_GAMMA10-2326 [hydrothermal vent metagenome]|uniref:Uncharacterized protein n=1 Tax=hydrothermal vent metagenome TaxID=652676 RepID=A0A3B0XUW7_9ZZZZ